jgi:hypothetical protein
MSLMMKHDTKKKAPHVKQGISHWAPLLLPREKVAETVAPKTGEKGN